MSITECPIYKNLKSKKDIGLGTLFFFEKFVVAEFNDGVTIDFESLSKYRPLLKEHFGDKEFGFISNRINSYAIVLTDAPKFYLNGSNLKAYATVTYNPLAEKVFNIENHFFKFNKKNFQSIDDAISWVENTLKLNQVNTI